MHLELFITFSSIFQRGIDRINDLHCEFSWLLPLSYMVMLFHYSVNCMNDTRNPLHVESTVETYNCKRGAITGMTNTTVYTNSTYNESESLVPIKPSKSLSYFTSWILIFIVKTLHVAYSCCLIYLYVYQYTCTLAQILLRFL